MRGDCERVTWYAALVMDDKKKTLDREDVGIDVEVEDRDSFASSAENGGVRGKNGLHFVCLDLVCMCQLEQPGLFPQCRSSNLSPPRRD